MENYKTEWADPKTFETKVVETKIPKDLVEYLQTMLVGAFCLEDWNITSALVSEDGSTIKFGIINRKTGDSEELSKKFVLTLSEFKPTNND